MTNQSPEPFVECVKVNVAAAPAGSFTSSGPIQIPLTMGSGYILNIYDIFARIIGAVGTPESELRCWVGSNAVPFRPFDIDLIDAKADKVLNFLGSSPISVPWTDRLFIEVLNHDTVNAVEVKIMLNGEIVEDEKED